MYKGDDRMKRAKFRAKTHLSDPDRFLRAVGKHLATIGQVDLYVEDGQLVTYMTIELVADYRESFEEAAGIDLIPVETDGNG